MKQEGIAELAARYGKAADEADAFLRGFLLEMGLRALAKTKQRTPVQTGYLRNSWQLGDAVVILNRRTLKRGKNKGRTTVTANTENSVAASLHSVKRSGNELEITLSNPVEYASYVEYGHKSMPWGRPPADEEDWVEGYYMATISLDEVRAAMPARFRAAFKAWLDKGGG